MGPGGRAPPLDPVQFQHHCSSVPHKTLSSKAAALLTQGPQSYRAAVTQSGQSYSLAGPGVKGAQEGHLNKFGDQKRFLEGES